MLAALVVARNPQIVFGAVVVDAQGDMLRVDVLAIIDQ